MLMMMGCLQLVFMQAAAQTPQFCPRGNFVQFVCDDYSFDPATFELLLFCPVDGNLETLRLDLTDVLRLEDGQLVLSRIGKFPQASENCSCTSLFIPEFGVSCDCDGTTLTSDFYNFVCFDGNSIYLTLNESRGAAGLSPGHIGANPGQSETSPGQSGETPVDPSEGPVNPVAPGQNPEILPPGQHPLFVRWGQMEPQPEGGSGRR